MKNSYSAASVASRHLPGGQKLPFINSLSGWLLLKDALIPCRRACLKTFAKFGDHFFFIVAMKIFVTLAIFLVFADFVKAFLAFSHTKTRILLNLLVLLFLPYSLLSLLI